MTTTTQVRRAVNYCRVSTTKQTGERHSSLETQQSRFREYCLNHELIPVAEFVDVASGRRNDRKQYLAMVEFVAQGGADVIVTQFLDRLGRKPSEIVPRFYQLQDQGVTLVCTDEDIKEELIFLLRAGIAGEESKKNSLRVRSYMAKSVSKGVHAARAPYGLIQVKAVEAGKVITQWEIDPSEAPLVREMYRLAVNENLGYKAIADRLEVEGHKARGGGPFKSYTVQKVLTNPAISGTLLWGKRPRKGNPQPELVEVRDFFPPILSVEEWDLLQNRLAIRRESPRGQSHSSEYLLSGIAKCGHCGGPMVGKRGGKYRRYYCNRYNKARASCGFSNGHSARKLEKAVLDYIGQFSDPEVVRQLAQQAIDDDGARLSVQAQQTELRSTEKRISQLEDLLLKDLDRLDRGIINEDEFRRINEARRAELSQLKTTQAELMQTLKDIEGQALAIERVPVEVKSFFEDIQSLDIRQQKARLQNIFRAIFVWTDNRIEVVFR